MKFRTNSGVENESRAYIEAFNAVRNNDSRNVRSHSSKSICDKGKACGSVCIPKGNKCHPIPKNSSNLSSPSSNRPSVAKDMAVAGAISGGVAVTGGFIALKYTSGKLNSLRTEYRAGFGVSAQMAQEKAKTVVVPDIDSSKTDITFAIGGFGTSDAHSESIKLAKNIESLGVEGHHLVPIPYKDFNLHRESSVPVQMIELFDKIVVENKRNPVSVELASQVIAYQKKYPNKQVRLVGHSGGGLVAQEAAEVLNKLDRKVQTTAIGTPDFGGLLQPVGDSVTIGTVNDVVIRAFGGKPIAPKNIDSVKGHFQENYFGDDTFNDYLRNRLQGKSLRSDSALAFATPKANATIKCKKGKPCGSICIPKSSKCRALEVDGKETIVAKSSSSLVTRFAKAAIITGASVAGIPVAAYLVQKARFNTGYGKSAKLAIEQSKSYSVPENLSAGVRSIYDQTKDEAKKTFVETRYSDEKPEQITFLIGGIGGKGGLESDYRAEELSTMFPRHHVVSVETPEQDVTPKPGDNVGSPDYMKRVTAAFLKDNLQKGRSEIAVRTAARLHAYHKQYPDIPINIMAQSGGTAPGRETLMIAKELGIKDIRLASAAGPYFGLTEPTGITLAAPPENDALIKNLGRTMPNKVQVSSVTGHGNYFIEGRSGQRNWDNGRDYTAQPNKEVQAILTKYFDRANRTDAVPRSETPKALAQTSRRGELKCKKGKPCGSICIPKSSKCRVKEVDGKEIITLRHKTLNDRLVKGAIVSGAALVGIPVATYLVQKGRFEANFPKSADLALEQAKNYQVPKDLKSGLRTIADQTGNNQTFVKSINRDTQAQQLTFAIGGIGGQGGKEGDYIGEELSNMFPRHHVVSVESPEQDVTPKPGDNVASLSYLKRVTKALLKDNLIKGRSEVGVRLAARAYAYHKEYPDKPINLVGQSGGAMPVREAAEILNRLKVKDVKVVSAGGPYFGLTPPRGITLASPNKDFLVTSMGITMPKKTWIESATGHSYYFVEGKSRRDPKTGEGSSTPNKETQKVLSNYFDRSQASPRTNLDSTSSAMPFGQALKVLRQIIDSAFTGGIDTITSVNTDSLGTISGQFKANNQVYDFNISRLNKLSYVESKVSLRNDSFNSDSVSQKQCGKGTPCGSSCVKRGFKCSTDVPKNAIKLLPQVRTATEKFNATPVNEKDLQTGLKSPELLVSAAVASALSTAATVGLPTATLLVARANYRQGLPKSADIVRDRVAKIDLKTVPSFANKEQITVVQTGFTGAMGARREAEGNKRFFKSVEGLLGSKHGVVGRANKEFNIPQISDSDAPEDMKPTDPEFLKVRMTPQMAAKFGETTLKQTVGTFFVKGRNPESINLATDVYALSLKNPGKPINLIGHSAGSMISREAAAILDTMGVKTKVATIGGPDFGVVDYAEVKHFHSKNDPVTGKLSNPKAKFYNEITSHSAENYINHPEIGKEIKDYFSLNGKKKRTDSMEKSGTSLEKLGGREGNPLSKDPPTFRKKLTYDLLKAVAPIIKRAYLDDIDRFLDIKAVDIGVVTGAFADGKKVIEFSLDKNKLSYKLSPSSGTARTSRSDSLCEIKHEALLSFIRTDAKKKSNCTVGISCGSSCISARKSCDLDVGSIASPSQMREVSRLAVALRVNQQAVLPPPPPTPTPTPTPQPTPTPTAKSDYKVNPTTGAEYTIRDLKAIAKDRMIYRYSEMTKEELRSALKTTDENPDQQRRIRKTLSKERGVAGRARKAGLNPSSSKPERAFYDSVKTWENIRAISKFAGTTVPPWGVAAVGAFLMGATLRTYERAKGSYRNGLRASADAAEERARNKPAPYTSSDNITFLVGSGKGYGAEEMKRLLTDNPKKTEQDAWFSKHKLVPFNLKEFGTPEYKGQKKDKNGNYTVGYTAHAAVNGVGGVVQNYMRGRNEDAVELAAQIHAQASHLNNKGFRQGHKDKKINILSHSSGGMVTREALDILTRMEPLYKGGPSGKTTLERVNVVNLGTPSFGFTENTASRLRTITSAQDPLSILPRFGEGSREQWISTVKGHDVEEYLKNEDVRSSIREVFGYYKESAQEQVRRRRKRGDSIKIRRSDDFTLTQLSASILRSEILTDTPYLVTSVRLDDTDQIVGQFIDRGEVFDYVISDRAVSYELNKLDSQWLDSYLLPKATALGIDVTDNPYMAIALHANSALEGAIRQDFLGVKQCKTGVPCGNTCLPKGSKCGGKSISPLATKTKRSIEDLKVKLGKGKAAKTLGGAGKNIEKSLAEPYLAARTSISKKLGTNPNNRQKLIRSLPPEVRHLLIEAGLGSVSKKLTSIGSTIDKQMLALERKIEDLKKKP